MGLNVSTGYQLENYETLRSTANSILNKSGVNNESEASIIEKTIFSNNDISHEPNPQLSVIKASTQISINETLKETLKYLRNHAAKKNTAKYTFGELWNILSTNNEASDKNPYRGELYDFEIDKNVKNIFAA